MEIIERVARLETKVDTIQDGVTGIATEVRAISATLEREKGRAEVRGKAIRLLPAALWAVITALVSAGAWAASHLTWSASH